MKHIIFLIYTLLFIGAGSQILAQTYASTNSPIIPRNIDSRAAEFSFLTVMNNTASNSKVVTNNAIFIQQVGSNNKVNSNTRSLRSDIDLFQYGTNNEIGMEVKAGIIDENIFQNGTNHKFFDFSPNGSVLHRTAVYQYGRNQNLLWYGNNSISEKLTINMKGKNQTVIIRNIKR